MPDRPDRTLTTAHITVSAKKRISEKAFEVELRERLRGLEVEKLEVERAENTYEDAGEQV